MHTLKLHDGTDFPAFGLGTWLSKKGEVYAAVRHALKVGYRHVDCAWIYFNEDEIGQALTDAFAEGDIKREDLWVTSKLWNDKHAPADVRPALEGTLADLKLDYIDLYLMHWPVPHKPGAARPKESSDFLTLDEMPLEATWEAMTRLPAAGLAKQVGVSNFSASKVAGLIDKTGIVPAVNQVELHPFLQQRELLDAMTEHGVVVTAYSPLGSRGRPDMMRRDDEIVLLEHPEVVRIAAELGATAGQVVIAWALARGTAVIPKSTNPARIEQNLAATKLELRPKDMEALGDLDRAERYVTGDFWCPPGSPHTLESLWG